MLYAVYQFNHYLIHHLLTHYDASGSLRKTRLQQTKHVFPALSLLNVTLSHGISLNYYFHVYKVSSKVLSCSGLLRHPHLIEWVGFGGG